MKHRTEGHGETTISGDTRADWSEAGLVNTYLQRRNWDREVPMPQTCTACRHPNRPDIDGAILRGESLRDIARQSRLSKDAVARHKPHVLKTLVKAHDAQEVARADSLLADVLDRETHLKALTMTPRASRRTRWRIKAEAAL
jgi:hypothetical protein